MFDVSYYIDIAREEREEREERGREIMQVTWCKVMLQLDRMFCHYQYWMSNISLFQVM